MSHLLYLLLLSFCCAEEQDTRNIIFLGQSNSGKSTLIKVLKNKDYDPPLFNLNGATSIATLNTFTIDEMDQRMKLNVVETPTMEDVEKTLLNVIEQCVDWELTDIHHIYYVMSMHHGVSPVDIDAFSYLISLLMDHFIIEEKVSIILSFAQEVDEEFRDHYIDQFRNVPDLKEIYDSINGRILFLGAAQKKKFVDMEMVRENVHQQRETVLNHMIRQTIPFDLRKLKLYQLYKDRPSTIGDNEESLHSVRHDL